MTMTRNDIMNRIDALIESNYDLEDKIDNILLKFGASEDDSDPEEGFYVTMSNGNLVAAYQAIRRLVSDKNDPKQYYKSLLKQRSLNVYEQGWVDGYEACKSGRME